MLQSLLKCISISVPVALLLLAGCSHETPPAKFVASPSAAPVAPPPTPTPAPAQSSAIHVSQDILTACGIKDSDTGGVPVFKFDSSSLSQDDQRLLKEVAACFETGPLRGRAVALTGRADPRGTEQYNITLGESRAESVVHYLHSLGMDTAKMSESSRGALDATGTDESSWRKNRRVDVSIAM